MTKQIENYTCTLEQAKRLKELHVEQDSLFYWHINEHKREWVSDELYKKNYSCRNCGCMDDNYTYGDCVVMYSAFTSQELGELILKCEQNVELSLHLGLNTATADIRKMNTSVLKVKNENGGRHVKISALENEAPARAEFLIYLLEKEKREMSESEKTVMISKLEINKIYCVLLDDIGSLIKGLPNVKRGWVAGSLDGIDNMEIKMTLLNEFQMTIPIKAIEDIREMLEEDTKIDGFTTVDTSISTTFDDDKQSFVKVIWCEGEIK